MNNVVPGIIFIGKAATNHPFKKNILAATAVLLVAFTAMPDKLTK